MAAIPAGDPWSAFGSAAGAALGAGPSSAGQSGSGTTVTMDGSNWTVSTGGGTVEATNSRNADVPAVAGAVGKVLNSSSTVLIAGLALAALVIVKVFKK